MNYKCYKIIVLILLFLVAGCGKSTKKESYFIDVPQKHWANEAISSLAEENVFKEIIHQTDKGDMFFPDKNITRAEFITITISLMYPSEVSLFENSAGEWWINYYKLALDKKIIHSFEFELDTLLSDISREESAMIIVRCIENNGEKITTQLPLLTIADYEEIGEPYKEFVEYSLLYGIFNIDEVTSVFSPKTFLTRSEAAVLVDRIKNKKNRIDIDLSTDFPSQEVIYDDSLSSELENESENNDGRNDQLKNDSTDNRHDLVENNQLTENKAENENTVQSLYPWENGGKHPSKYTWKEYIALSSTVQDAFIKTFNSYDDYEKWMEKALQNWYGQITPDDDSQINQDNKVYPWESGGKKPNEYTWKEFENLSDIEQEAFYNWFSTSGAFEFWMDSVKQEGSDTKNYPWENGGKKPNEYTWEEFENLSDIEQEAFYNWFSTSGAFEFWMDSVKQEGSDTKNYPWENGGKKPNEYTWEEFENLSDIEQEAFFEWFSTLEEFELWMETVTN